MLQAAHRHLGGQVDFVGIDVRDRPDGAAALLRTIGTSYPQWADPSGRLPGQLGSPGIPISLLVGPDGTIVYRHVGAMTSQQLAAAIKAVLATR